MLLRTLEQPINLKVEKKQTGFFEIDVAVESKAQAEDGRRTAGCGGGSGGSGEEEEPDARRLLQAEEVIETVRERERDSERDRLCVQGQMAVHRNTNAHFFRIISHPTQASTRR
jgi:hypothetical protein